jgi:two-component system, OmpR family, response regulator
MSTTTDEVDVMPDLGDVTLVQWPREEALRADLAAARRPRLLLIDADQAPPLVWDELEDWVRQAADGDELRLRAETLRRRARPPAPPWPVLDAHGVLREGTRWTAVPPIEARILAPLLQRPEQVVSRAHLLESAWPGEPSRNRLLDRRIMLLRGRLTPVGLVVRTVRGKGFLLERSVP